MEREAISHLRPTLGIVPTSVPSTGRNRHKDLEVGMRLSCLGNSKAKVSGPVNEVGTW